MSDLPRPSSHRSLVVVACVSALVLIAGVVRTLVTGEQALWLTVVAIVLMASLTLLSNRARR